MISKLKIKSYIRFSYLYSIHFHLSFDSYVLIDFDELSFFDVFVSCKVLL